MKKDYFWSLLVVMMASLLSVGFSSCRGHHDPDEVTVYPPAVSFNSDGGQQPVTIQSNTKWTITGMINGITFMPTTGKGDATITLIATENTDKTSRNGYFMVNAGDASASISVSQSAKLPETKVTITNNSTYTLERFNVHFVNSKYEELSVRDFGTLYPNGVVEADIPTGATEYYMATYLNRWYFSADYSIEITRMFLTNAEVDNWSANSSSNRYPIASSAN